MTNDVIEFMALGTDIIGGLKRGRRLGCAKARAFDSHTQKVA